MTRINEIAAVLLLPLGLLAGSAPKENLVAAGYPDWQGLSAKSYISGREICPSDLRHKATVVIEVEPGEKLADQLLAVALIVSHGASIVDPSRVDWMTLEMPRDSIVVISNCGTGGVKEHEMILQTLKSRGKNDGSSRCLAGYMGVRCSFYDNVTFTGAPDGTGKRPFAYVMGPEGRDPLFQGQVTKASINDAISAIQKAKKMIAGWDNKWRPFFGNIPDPEFHPQLAKAIQKGRAGKTSPLDVVANAILKDVASADEKRAKEAQILFDAINQTRSDLELRIKLETSLSPHRAYYDILELLKYWPSEKKRVEAAYARLKGNPDVEATAKVFCKLMVWGDPGFTPRNAGEVKKIIQELRKMKKTLVGPKASQDIQIQNAALLVDAKIDVVLATMSSRTR